MRQVAELVQGQFAVLLLLAFAAGLALPAVGLSALCHAPDWLIPLLLATVLFFACARITPSDLAAVSLRQVGVFYALRFLALPALAYAGCWLAAPSIAQPVALLLLLPAGVTTAAIAGILRGNAALALGATVLSTALAPLTIPLAFWAMGTSVTGVDPVAMSKTLLVILVAPTVIYVGVARRSASVVNAMREVGGLVSIGLICTIALLVSASQRHRILADPGSLVVDLALGLLAYASLYALGLVWSRGSARRERIGWTLSSGNNNIVLGLTLAVLHLSPADVLHFVAWDLAWIIGLSGIQPVLSRLTAADAR